MNIDVSPDNKTLLVDVLGDLYTLPAAGGEMTPLTTGMAWDYQAKYSPDGKQIVFISDREGSDNVWVMNSDGSGAHSLTKEKKYMFGSPTWAPDGQYIVARRYGTYPFESYLRKSELWMFHKEGGAGIQITKGDARLTRASGPAFSPDAKFLYFSAVAGRFTYNADPGKWQIHRLNRETGEVDAITGSYGGGLRPVISPDGKSLVYATRRDGATGLRMRNLDSREEAWLSHRITRDDQEGFSAQDTLPGYGFSRDGKSLFILIDGHIHRIDVASREDSEIPFTCNVKRELGALMKVDDSIHEDPLEVRQLRWLQANPMVPLCFSARSESCGSLRAAARPGGSQHPRTANMNRPISRRPMDCLGHVERSTGRPALEGAAGWFADHSAEQIGRVLQSSRMVATDASRIAVIVGSSSGWLEEDASDSYELRTVPAAGGNAAYVTHLRSPHSNITWSGNGQRLFYDEVNPATPAAMLRLPLRSSPSAPTGSIKRRTFALPT